MQCCPCTCTSSGRGAARHSATAVERRFRCCATGTDVTRAAWCASPSPSSAPCVPVCVCCAALPLRSVPFAAAAQRALTHLCPAGVLRLLRPGQALYGLAIVRPLPEHMYLQLLCRDLQRQHRYRHRPRCWAAHRHPWLECGHVPDARGSVARHSLRRVRRAAPSCHVSDVPHSPLHPLRRLPPPQSPQQAPRPERHPGSRLVDKVF